jgi:hypothetical protein
MWDVVRWFAVFVIAVLLLVVFLFWIFGRPLPFPNLF